MRNPAWQEFKLSVPINAKPDHIYDSWATQNGLESWFLRQALFQSSQGTLREKEEPVQPGDRYEWLWHGYSDEVLEKGEILYVNNTDQIQFTFGGNCKVTIRIFSKSEAIICELIQENIPIIDDPVKNLNLQCSKGWTFYMANLKSVLEGGLDLRNRDMSLGKVITA